MRYVYKHPVSIWGYLGDKLMFVCYEDRVRIFADVSSSSNTTPYDEAIERRCEGQTEPSELLI